MRGAGPQGLFRRLFNIEGAAAPAAAPPPVQFPEHIVRITTGPYDTNSSTLGLFIGSIDGGGAGDATCEIQYDGLKTGGAEYTLRLAYINMGYFKGKHLCKHLFRETLRYTLSAVPDKVRIVKINSIGTSAGNERARALNCYNTVLEEFQFNHTMDAGDRLSPARPLDPTEGGTRYWSRE